MLLSAGGFSAILQSLGLVLSQYKPLPSTNSVSRDVNVHQGKVLLQTLEEADLCQVAPYNVTVLQQQFLPFDHAQAMVFRYRQQQSVNLGSWLVSSCSHFGSFANQNF